MVRLRSDSIQFDPSLLRAIIIQAFECMTKSPSINDLKGKRRSQNPQRQRFFSSFLFIFNDVTRQEVISITPWLWDLNLTSLLVAFYSFHRFQPSERGMCGTWCFTGPNSKPPLARIPTSSARVSANLRGSDCRKPLASGHHFDSRYPRSEWSLTFQVKSFKLEVSRLQLGFGLILSHFPSWTKRCQWHCETLPASERPGGITSDEKWFVYSWQHKTTMLSTNCDRSPCHFSRLLGKASLTCSQLQLLATLAPAMWIHELLLFPWKWKSDPAKSDQKTTAFTVLQVDCASPLVVKRVKTLSDL